MAYRRLYDICVQKDNENRYLQDTLTKLRYVQRPVESSAAVITWRHLQNSLIYSNLAEDVSAVK